MGKTFVEDERPCDSCVNVTRYGCVSWNCEYINRDEAIKAWREKHEMADRKTEPFDKDINVRSKDELQEKCYKCFWWNYSYGCQNPKGICEYEPQSRCKSCKHYYDAYSRPLCRECDKHDWYEAEDEPQERSE